MLSLLFILPQPNGPAPLPNQLRVAGAYAAPRGRPPPYPQHEEAAFRSIMMAAPVQQPPGPPLGPAGPAGPAYPKTLSVAPSAPAPPALPMAAMHNSGAQPLPMLPVIAGGTPLTIGGAAAPVLAPAPTLAPAPPPV